MLGIGFHSFIDGFIYAITFTVSIFTGLLAATGMVLHEFPEGIIGCTPDITFQTRENGG
jgi:zinc transporter ZupT